MLKSKTIILSLIVGAVLIQLIPYGKDHINPPVFTEPQWDSPKTKELFLKKLAQIKNPTTFRSLATNDRQFLEDFLSDDIKMAKVGRR